LLDALSLVRALYKKYNVAGNIYQQSEPEQAELMSDVLRHFEDEMLARSSVKVEASAKAAQFLHSEVAIQEGNVTRGAAANITTTPTAS
jgi:salicylate hydroxylase